MDCRLHSLYVLLLGWHFNAATTYLATRGHLEQACSSYLQNTPRAPEKLITCLRYFQKDSVPSRNSTLIRIISELYAADLMLLNELSHISQKNAGVKAPIIQLFPNGLSAAGKRLYHEAELLISGALQKL